MRLPHNEVQLWQADTDEWSFSGLSAKYGHWLSEAEQARLKRLRSPQAALRLLLGRVLMRGVLCRYLHIPNPQALPLVAEAGGKPALASASADEAGLIFNLSHSQRKVLLAVAMMPDAQVSLGVDIEWMRRQRRVSRIAGRYFAEDECSGLLSLPEPQRLERFYTLWTLKEAYIKARGLGLALPLQQFAFSLGGSGLLTARFNPTLPNHSGHWRFWSLQTAPDYRIGLSIGTAATAAPAAATAANPPQPVTIAPEAFCITAPALSSPSIPSSTVPVKVLSATS